MSSGGMHLSKEFFELLKAIGESKSKQEEDRIVSREVARLKGKLEVVRASAPGSPAVQNSIWSSKKRTKEFLVRLLYIEMLGHDGSFGYIKAVELAASASLYHKRTGYLVCSACLPPDHEFRFMLVNQMQRDLQSTNVLECSGGLIACISIITADMVPAVSSEVVKLLAHDSGTIRKKAIIALHRLHQLAPDAVTAEELAVVLRKLVCDKEPSVMGSSLNVMQALSLSNPLPFKELVPSLVSILKQIGEHRLPTDYDYHRVPAPWMQIQLVRLLGTLGRADSTVSSGMYEILNDAMKKADTGINAGYAIVYECIKTIVTIYPNASLLDAAAESISRFIQSRSHNLKYLGVTGLAMIVEQHPQYAAQHQLAVMDCLEDADETLQRKTLDLLYRMTNPVNVEFIAEKLVDFLSGTTDLFLKKVLTVRVCSIAERYAPNNAWYIRTITKLFEVAGDMVSTDVAQNLMSLIAEGTGESEEADMLLRQNAVEIYVALLRDKPVGSLPRILLETMAWCLGEYGYLSAVSSLDDTMTQLCRLARVHKAKLAPVTRKFLLSAIMKLVAQAGTCPPHAAAVIDDYTKSRDVDLQQRCLEFQNMLTNCPNLLPEILPVDASAEDVDVDPDLTFLDAYVFEAMNNGARQYEKPEDDEDDDDGYMGSGDPGQSAFKMTPYEKPQAPAQARMAMSGMGSGATRSSQAAGSLPPGSGAYGGSGNAAVTTAAVPDNGLSLNTQNVANVWGRGGITQPQPTPATLPPTSAPASSNTWENHATSSSSQSQGGYGGNNSIGYGGNGGYGTPAPAPEPVKTPQQLEKERQAAALFGGMIPGAPPPPPTQASAPVAAPPPPKASPPPAPAAPAPEVDLLDMSMWDACAPAPASAPAVTDFDVLSPTPTTAPTVYAHTLPTVSAHTLPTVETVSDDEDDAAGGSGGGIVEEVDPFAGAGLLGDVYDKPLPTMASSTKFEYSGNTLAPLQLSTAQFGQKWGSCPATSPLAVNSSKISSLDKFMETCTSAGFYKVEAISATNEGICAGMINGGAQIALIHGKVTPIGTGGSKIDATVKSTDQSMGGSLAMYLQTMLR